jgi:cupin fold WbuC family metalloprotein
MSIIDKNLLDEVTNKAISSPRLRMNHNFHESYDSKSQRLLNALEPGTELPIHRHRNTSETYILLRGKMKVFFYDENKVLMQEFYLDPLDGKYGVDIPVGQWHTIEVLESGTVIFEVKDGPYTPINNEDILE